MRITFLSHEFPPIGGGAATALDALTLALARRGHDIQIITVGLEGKTSFLLKPGNRQIVFLRAGRTSFLVPSPLELLSSCFALRFLSKIYLKQFTPQVLVAFFAFPAGLMAIGPARHLGIPLVVSLRGSDVPGFYAGRWNGFVFLRRLLVRPVWNASELLVANGSHLTRLAEQFTPTKAIENIPNGVDTSRFCPSKKQPHKSMLRILFVGQLIERKGLLETLRALKGFHASPVHLSVVGEGPLQNAAQSLVRNLAEGVTVTFLGHRARQEMPRIYRDHDVLVHLSHGEGVSNVLLEAMSSGLAVVVSKSTAGEQSLDDSGIVLDTMNPKPIRQAIAELAQNRNLLYKKQRAARRHALTMDWEASAQRLESALVDVLDHM